LCQMYCTSRQSSQGRQSSYTVQYNDEVDHYDDANDSQVDVFDQATAVPVTAFAAKRSRNIPFPPPLIRRQSNRFHNPSIPATQMMIDEYDPFDVNPLTVFHTSNVSPPSLINDDGREDDIEYHLHPNSNSTQLNQTYSTPGRQQLMSDLSQQST